VSIVRPVLKRLHSPDIPDLESYSPEDPNSFSFLLQAMFGPEGGEGDESFDIVICTPAWLSREVARKGFVDGRHHLIVREYNLSHLRSFLSQYAKNSASNTWQEAANKLSRLGKWEFEDYKP
jgi:Immunity protein 8